MTFPQGLRTRRRVERLLDPAPARSVLAAPALRMGSVRPNLAFAVVALLVMGLGFGPVAIPIAGLGVLAGRGWWRHRARITTSRRRSEQLPEALERMAGALRTGSSLPHALAEARRTTEAPLGAELATLAHAAEQGYPLLDVLDRWTQVHDDPGTRLAATALALATGVGAAPARAIDGVAATLRERLAQAAERRTQAVQAHYSAVVLSAAPLVFTGLLALTNAAAADFLLRTPAGWACLLVGVGLDVLGAVWMMRLVHTGDQP